MLIAGNDPGSGAGGGVTSRGRRQSLGFIEPCIPTRVDKPPVGPQWIHEIKHDGYLLIVRKQGYRVRLFTRCGFDWTDRYPRIVRAATKLRASSAVIDGEAVCCDQAGVADFEKWKAAQASARRHPPGRAFVRGRRQGLRSRLQARL